MPEKTLLTSTLISQTEHELKAILFSIRIPVGPIPITRIISFVFDFTGWNTESDGFIRFCGNLDTNQSEMPRFKMKYTHNEVLVSLIWWLSFLLPSTHKSPTRQDIALYLRQMYLHHHSFLSSVSVTNLGNAVTWPTNFKEDFSLDVCLSGSNHELRVFSITGSTTSKISLMFLSLGVS